MGILGIVLILVGLVLSWAAEATARGRLGVNALVGIRVGYVTASPEAWLAGHRAGRLATHAAAAVFALAGILVLALNLSEDEAGWIIISACVIALAAVIVAAILANRAAKQVVYAELSGQRR